MSNSLRSLTRCCCSCKIWVIAVAGALVVLSANAADPPMAEVAAALKHLLAVAEVRSKDAPAEAKRRFEAALRAADDKRPVLYAYGLVLRLTTHDTEALQQFDLAAADKTGPHIPAAKAEVVLMMQGKKWANAAVRCERFAKWLSDGPDAWPTPEDCRRDARWLGQALAAGTLIATAATDVARLQQADAAVRTLLSPELAIAYIAGFESVTHKFDELGGAAKSARETARQGQEQELDQKKVQNALDQTILNATAADLEKEYDDKMAQLHEEFNRLEAEYKAESSRRDSVNHTIRTIEKDIDKLKDRRDDLKKKKKSSKFFDNEISEAEKRLQKQINERTEIEQKMNLANLSAQRVNANRQSLLVAGAQAGRKLDQAKTKLDLGKKALEHQNPTGHTAGTKVLADKQKSIAGYLAWDWEALRQSWLDELAQVEQK
jgi:hypothetical protein